MYRFISILILLGFAACNSQDEQKLTMDEAINDPKAAHLAHPGKAQYEYHERERIMFVHLSPATWQGVEWDREITPLKDINPKDAGFSFYVEEVK